jgi:ribose/xylose/arabinose/galactoside ABC-type transport system permease subunit
MKRKGIALASAARISGPFFGLLFIVGLFAAIDYLQAQREGREVVYLTASNFVNVSNQTVIFGIAALGMTLVIASGGIDLSVGSMIALVTVVVALVLRAGAVAGGTAVASPVILPMAAAAAGIATGAGCGFANGFLITRLKVVPFIITLGMMGIARGVAKMLASEQKIDAPTGWLKSIMATPFEPGWLSFSWGVWFMFVFAVLTAFVMRSTVFGRYAFAIGSNEATALLCGVNVARTKTFIYTLGGAYAGLAGVMMFSILSVGDPTAAWGKELDVIAAVVIGGGSLSGGEGSILGTVIGAYIMSFLRNGCDTVGLPNYLTEILIGIIIICAVAIDQVRHGRRRS